MAKHTRKIVKIDEDRCDGCGLCVTGCAEGAIQVIDGKARLVSETYCDGLGACLGECPQGAITIEERPADAFDEDAVREHLRRIGRPEDAIHASPAAHPHAPSGGCPGSALRVLQHDAPAQPAPAAGGGCPGSAMRRFQSGQGRLDPAESPAQSALGHWPVQLMLVPPHAPFLQNADLLVCADCVPFAVPDFHQRYLAGRAVLVGCPKLDDLELYRQKLTQIVAQARPASLTVLRMEVPCCAGIAQAVVAARDAAAPQLPVIVHTVGIQGGAKTQVA